MQTNSFLKVGAPEKKSWETLHQTKGHFVSFWNLCPDRFEGRFLGEGELHPEEGGEEGHLREQETGCGEGSSAAATQGPYTLTTSKTTTTTERI